MTNLQTLEVPIKGMDCAECTQHVQHAIEKLPGVQSVNVFLGTEKAIVRLNPAQVHCVEDCQTDNENCKDEPGITTIYNVVGLSLAAFGFLQPVLAAALQSLPDIGIMGNSARLLKQK